MRTITSLLLMLATAAVQAQDSAATVTAEQVGAFRAGLEKGCKDAGRRRGDPQQRVDGFCNCMMEALSKSMTYEEWQQAVFYSVNKRDHEEMLVLKPHMSKVQACRPAS